MCVDAIFMQNEEFESIVEKYNNEIQQMRIKSSITEIIENLEKLYFNV